MSSKYPDGMWLAVTALKEHGLEWPADDPAFGYIQQGFGVLFVTAPPTRWGHWSKEHQFPTNAMTAREATEDEIAVAQMKAALLPDPLPSLP